MKISNFFVSIIAIIGFAIISNAQVPNYVPTIGLDGWWPFTGNANDQSGNNNNGTVNGATITSDRFGNVGQAYGFDGINDNVSLNNSFFNGSPNVLQLTFSVWIYCTALPVNSSAFISGKEGYWRSKFLFIEPNGSIHFGRTQPNPQNYIDVNSGVNSIQLNSWQNIIITFIGGNLSMYINGNLIASSIIPYMSLDYSYLAAGNSTSTNLIGAVNPASGLSDFFTGKIDDMGMWNRVLTQCEIHDLYTSQTLSGSLSAVVNNVNCFGGNTGAIDLSVGNATNPITYLWSTGATTQDLTNLTAGSYTVNVTDINNCTATANYTITQNANILLSDISTNVICNGASTGSIDLSVVGGTPNYTYLWSNSTTSQDLTAIASGNYSVTVTDANGCVQNAAYIITQGTAINDSVVQTNVNCFGASTGAIDITVAGGTVPYTYLWGNSSTLQDINALTAGNYSLTITDSNNCTGTFNYTIPETPALALSAVVTNVICNGASTGSIDLSVVGGTPNYTYLWSNSATSQDLIAITAGNYSVTVTDTNACAQNTDYTLTQGNPTFVSAGADQTICNGEQVTLSASNSQNYSWNNGVTDNVSFSPATTQDYIVTADTTGCQSSDTVIIFVNQQSSSTLNETALDSYMLNGQTYTQSGTYTQIIPAANGCDSTITLNLTLNFTGIHELSNSNKVLVKITDLNGKIIQRRKNTVMLFIYEDGTVERLVEVE